MKRSLSDPSPARRRSRWRRVPPSLRRLRAILYGWSNCPACRRARELLESRGVAHRSVLLDDRKDEVRRLQEIFGRTDGPLVLLDGRMLCGVAELERELG